MPEQTEIELLLVEDDDDDARFIQRLLVEYKGVDEQLVEVTDVTRAKRLAGALDRVENEPDIVLLDLMLPDSKGLETVETLVERAPHLPVVVITGSADADRGPEAIKRGAQDYLEKGRLTDEKLYRTIRYAIDRNETSREIVELNHRLSFLNQLVRQDIRTDLHMVVGRGDELRGQVGAKHEQTVDSLLDAASHAVDLTETASELMAVLSTEYEPDRQPIDLGQVLAEQRTHLDKHHDVSLTVADPTNEEVPTVAATPMLGTALEQLLSNAVRHNDNDVPAVTIEIEPRDEEVSLAVADDGVGMSDRRKRLLNDPEGWAHEQSGIGTGLYLVLTFAEQIDATVEFADNQPTGTVVTLTLQRWTAR